MSNYNYFDDMFCDYEREQQPRHKELTIEDITNKMLKVFVSENKKTLIKEVSQLYKQDWLNNTDTLTKYKDSINNLKDKYALFMVDVYCDHKQINKLYKEEQYIRYAQRKLNEYLKQKVFN